MLKKVILASSGYSLITFVHGFTWHLVFFKQVYETFGVYNRANPIIPIGFASMVIQGVVLAVLYHRQVKEIPAPSFKMAIEFNLLMGLFFTSGTVLALAAKAEIHHLSAWLWRNPSLNSDLRQPLSTPRSNN